MAGHGTEWMCQKKTFMKIVGIKPVRNETLAQQDDSASARQRSSLWALEECVQIDPLVHLRSTLPRRVVLHPLDRNLSQ